MKTEFSKHFFKITLDALHCAKDNTQSCLQENKKQLVLRAQHYTLLKSITLKQSAQHCTNTNALHQ